VAALAPALLTGATLARAVWTGLRKGTVPNEASEILVGHNVSMPLFSDVYLCSKITKLEGCGREPLVTAALCEADP
jgi:hypothetical protein